MLLGYSSSNYKFKNFQQIQEKSYNSVPSEQTARQSRSVKNQKDLNNDTVENCAKKKAKTVRFVDQYAP